MHCSGFAIEQQRQFHVYSLDCGWPCFNVVAQLQRLTPLVQQPHVLGCATQENLEPQLGVPPRPSPGLDAVRPAKRASRGRRRDYGTR